MVCRKTLVIDFIRSELITSHRRMEQIVKTMTRLERTPVWRRFWRKDKHDDALIEHKKSLEHARLRIFQVCPYL